MEMYFRLVGPSYTRCLFRVLTAHAGVCLIFAMIETSSLKEN